MKKFLSLVMALVMTMSLVTIGAGATEYKDLTDKSEIQYEEAVAVLNKLGIISGYEDGSFRPTGALTRGAAAKIIVSLIQGADFANNLTVTAAPYSDVPVTNTFAAVISYCKTAGYINGYTDGTFRPAAALTGYAFTKMLLGALGYKSEYEGFTGTGWTMNVAALGSGAGLFNDFQGDGFKGNDGVDRQSACLLALNTLKATEVKYVGGTSISSTTGDLTTNIQQKPTREYVTSNNKAINANIYGQDGNTGNNSQFLTLQFGEDHFRDLKLMDEGSADDDFYRPSNKWSFKNVAIGTFAHAPDYVYTTGASGDTKADKVKDMGLKGFNAPTSYYENGRRVALAGSDHATRLENLTDVTDNGVQVEIFMDPTDADTIERIVVVRSQMMQVAAVHSSEVTLKKLEDDKKNDGEDVTFGTQTGFVAVNSVKDDDADSFKVLKDLKADDYVLVVPVLDGSSYKVASVTVPQTVTGKLTNIYTKSTDLRVKSINLAGTEYGMSNTWTSEDDNLSQKTILSDTTETTAYLDTFGYAIFVKDVKANNGVIIIDQIYNSLVDGKIVKYAKGWNTSGDELSINLGSAFAAGPGGESETDLQGTVYEYAPTTSNDAEYALVAHGTDRSDPDNTGLVFAPSQAQWIKNGQFTADIEARTNTLATNVAADTGAQVLPMASDVKFIFLSTESGAAGSDVTGITVRNGVTAIGEDKNNNGVYDAGSTDTIYKINYVLNKDKTKVVAVVVANDDDAAVTANLIYIQTVNEHWIDTNDSNKTKSMFKAYDAQGNLLDDGHSKYNKNVTNGSLNGQFFTYSKDSNGVYSLTAYTKTDKTTAVNSTTNVVINDRGYFTGNGINNGTMLLNANGAAVVDLDTGDGVPVSSISDMRQAILDGKASSFDLAYIYNGSDNAGSKTVSTVFVLKTNTAGVGPFNLAGTGKVTFSTTIGGTYTATLSTVAKNTPVYVKADDASATGIAITGQAVTASGTPGIWQFNVQSNVVVGDITVTIPGAYAGVSEIDITTPASVKLLFKGNPTASTAPTLLEQVGLLKAKLEANNYVVTAVKQMDGTNVTLEAHTSVMGITGPDVDFILAAGDVKQAVNITVGTTARFVDAAATVATVTGVASSANNFVTSDATAASGGYIATTATVEDGKTYGTVGYVEQTIDTSALASNGTLAYKSDGATVTTLPDYVEFGKTITIQLTVTGGTVLTNTTSGAIFDSGDSANCAVSATGTVAPSTTSGGKATYATGASSSATDEVITFVYTAVAGTAMNYTTAYTAAT